MYKVMSHLSDVVFENQILFETSTEQPATTMNAKKANERVS